ncbi:MAG: antitoxin Xre/MbcA/ParS toxin-binding domain-containing protein [Gemmatimonadaceae bacterium]
MSAQRVAERLGGPGVLKTTVRSELDLARAIHDGLPIRVVDEVLGSGLLEPNELYALVIPRRTLAHRREKRQPLSPEESDRLTRVVRVLARTQEALGDDDKAARWMRTPNRALGGSSPIDLLDSDVGARMVEHVIGRIEHGVYS